MNDEKGQIQAEPIASHPTIFVIFGITGDLASRKLLPALISLYAKKMLPQKFAVVGFSRRAFDREEFREYIRSRLNVRPGQFKEEDIKHFLDHMLYEQGFFDNAVSYKQLSSRLEAIDDRFGQCSNKLFHLSVPPHLYEKILLNLSSSGLTIPCDDNIGWTRILIEKPFGNDLNMARSLDKLLGKLFKEKQIFRIDHYLAKEALQNILAFRFTNPIFGPMWSNRYIDKIHIKLYEKDSIEGRGHYYDPIGALRDNGQNHILQMLAAIAMNRPQSFSADLIRKERAKIISSLKKVPAKKLKSLVTRGQYHEYINEAGVSAGSRTETYFRLKAEINLSRWRGVPFYLESGKALYEKKTEIDIYFKGDKKTRATDADGFVEQNILTFRIQPDEGIRIKFFVKIPGPGFETEAKTLRFKYADVPSLSGLPDDYERLIQDAFTGDQTLFASTHEIMASWKYIMPIMENWDKLPLKIYEKGAREI